MRIAYVTSSLPRGPREAFLLPELIRLVELGHDVTVVPVRPTGKVIHGECERLASHVLVRRLLGPSVLAGAALEATRSPRRLLRALSLLLRSRSVTVLAKNLLVVPKGLWLAGWARRQGIDHLHAAWLSTPSTVTLVAAEMLGIPWSASGHRWDIEEDNLLAEKACRARFVRAISRRGAAAIAAQAGQSRRVEVIRMGIHVPPLVGGRGRSRRILIAGNLIPLKGHHYLFAAVAELRAAGVDVSLDVVGDGPLRLDLQAERDRDGLSDAVAFRGQLPHDRLLDELAVGRWAAVVVASVVDESGATEGVPVIMLEAMARGVPVVATDVGGISEIADGGAAVLVPQRDAAALAGAIAMVLRDEAAARRLATAAHARVRSECDVDRVVEALVAEMSSQHGPGRRRSSTLSIEAAA